LERGEVNQNDFLSILIFRNKTRGIEEATSSFPIDQANPFYFHYGI
jgi:hypothetical protein